MIAKEALVAVRLRLERFKGHLLCRHLMEPTPHQERLSTDQVSKPRKLFLAFQRAAITTIQVGNLVRLKILEGQACADVEWGLIQVGDEQVSFGGVRDGQREPRPGAVRVERQTETGYHVVESESPALITVTAGANDPRYPTLKGIMQAKQKPVDTLSLSDLGLSGEEAKPTQEVIGIEPVPEREAGEVVEDPGEAPAKVVEFLKKAKVI